MRECKRNRKTTWEQVPWIGIHICLLCSKGIAVLLFLRKKILPFFWYTACGYKVTRWKQAKLYSCHCQKWKWNWRIHMKLFIHFSKISLGKKRNFVNAINQNAIKWYWMKTHHIVTVLLVMTNISQFVCCTILLHLFSYWNDHLKQIIDG